MFFLHLWKAVRDRTETKVLSDLRWEGTETGSCRRTRIHSKLRLHCHLLSKSGIAVFPIMRFFFFSKLNSTMIWLIQFFASFVRVLGKMKQWKNKFSQNLERYTKKSSFTLASFFKMWFNDSFNKDSMSPYQGLVFLLLRWRMRWAGSCPHKAFSLVEKEMEGGRRNRCAGRVSSVIKIRE